MTPSTPLQGRFFISPRRRRPPSGRRRGRGRAREGVNDQSKRGKSGEQNRTVNTGCVAVAVTVTGLGPPPPLPSVPVNMSNSKKKDVSKGHVFKL